MPKDIPKRREGTGPKRYLYMIYKLINNQLKVWAGYHPAREIEKFSRIIVIFTRIRVIPHCMVCGEINCCLDRYQKNLSRKFCVSVDDPDPSRLCVQGQ